MEITSEGFIKVEIDDEMYQRAKEKADEMGELRNSIRQGKGNLVGFLGEEIVIRAFPNAKSMNTYEHDIDMDGIAIEVKSKDRTVNPRLDYEASVANFNTRQRADYYVFTSIYRDKTCDKYLHGHIIGMIEKPLYKEAARFLKVGDIDPSNNWVVKAACYNMPYSELPRFG